MRKTLRCTLWLPIFEKVTDIVFIPFWYSVTSKKDWPTLNDIKKDFNSVDYVGNHRFVFNIKGNNYRLIAIISFNAKKVYIRFIGTHSEYDKIKDIQNI